VPREVKRTTIYIEPAVDLALARRAAAEGKTKDEVIAAALRTAAADAPSVRPRAIGVFTGPADLSGAVDRYLTESGFGAP
jgi:hypothetical protein